MQQPINWIEIFAFIANMATAVGLIVAIYQLYKSNAQHREKARRVAAKEAVEIANLFQKTVINDFSFISSVLGLTGQKQYFGESEKLKCFELRFTQEEMVKLFGAAAYEELAKQNSKINPGLLAQAAIRTDQIAAYEEFDTKDPKGAVKKQVDVINQINAFNQMRNGLLNTMEWAAMTIVTGIAAEDVIYQSLHQVVLRYVRMEYPTIAMHNSELSACDQFYTNLILLYQMWSEKELAAKEKDEDNLAKHEIDIEEQRLERERNRDKNVTVPRPIK